METGLGIAGSASCRAHPQRDIDPAQQADPTFGRSSNAFVYGITLHSASSAPAHALSEGAA